MREKEARLGRVAAPVFAAVLASGSAAWAQTSAPPGCSVAAQGQPGSLLYIDGPSSTEGSALETLFEAVAPLVSAFAGLVYIKDAPCTAIGHVISQAAGSMTADYLTPGAAPVACTPSVAAPDLAVSDVSAATCTQALSTAPLSAAQLDVFGPVQPIGIVVPSSSTQAVISADAAYVVFGFDASNYVVAPWSDPASVFTPSVTSGPLGLVGAVIGLSPAKWATAKTSMLTSTTSLVSAIAADAMPNAAIGVLPMPIAQQTAGLDVLAFQAANQACGYLPDSGSLERDKINVRQGRYGLWGPVHLVTRIDGSGDVVDASGASSPALAAVIAALSADGPSGSVRAAAPDGGADSGQSSVAGPAVSVDAQRLLGAVAGAGFVPWCAMQVTRATDGGPEASYAPPVSCECDFETILGATTHYCTPCQTDADCTIAAPSCQYGFCEVQ